MDTPSPLRPRFALSSPDFVFLSACSFEYRYARYTTIATLLGVQVKYLKFFSLFFADDVFVYCLLSIFGLSLLCLGYTYPRTN